MVCVLFLVTKTRAAIEADPWNQRIAELQAQKDKYEAENLSITANIKELNLKREGLKAGSKEALQLDEQIEDEKERLRLLGDRVSKEKENTRNLNTGIKTAETYRNKYKELADQAAKFGAQVTKAANHIRQGFNAALRASVALATAFYYKLNQSTQALIEFERE